MPISIDGSLLDLARSIAAPMLLVWLLAETVWDFKDQNIPLFFSIIPLSTGLAVLALSGEWLTALLIGLLVLATNLNPTPRMVAVAAGVIVAAANIPPAFFPLLAGFVIVFFLFHLNVMGGADALAAIYLLVWFPSSLLLGSLFAGMLLAAVGILVLRFRRRVWGQITNTVSGRASGTRMPSLVGFFLGALAFFSYLFGPGLISAARQIFIP